MGTFDDKKGGGKSHATLPLSWGVGNFGRFMLRERCRKVPNCDMDTNINTDLDMETVTDVQFLFKYLQCNPKAP